MYWNLLKEKWFWIIWLMISLIGGVIGFVFKQGIDNKLRESKTATCVEFRNLKAPSIIAIESIDYKEEYIKMLTDTNNGHDNFPWSVIDNKQMVQILDYTSDSVLVKVAIRRNNPTWLKPSYEELWVWSKFVRLN